MKNSLGAVGGAPARPAARRGDPTLLAAQRRPMHVAEIATRLGVEAGSYDALQRVLDDLAFDGRVAPMSGHRFRLSREQTERHGAEVEGVLSVNPRGFGYLVARAGDDGDIYIPPEASVRGGLARRHGRRARRHAARDAASKGEVLRIVQRRAARVAGIAPSPRQERVARARRLAPPRPDPSSTKSG